MATEDEILKTLQRIEKSLAGGSVASGLGRAPAAPRGAGTQRNPNNAAQDREDTKNSGNQKKTYRANTASMNSLNDATTNLNRSFWGLNKTVTNTRSNFIEMNRSMRAYTKGAPTANVTGGQQQIPQGTDATGISGFISKAFKTIFGRKTPAAPITPATPQVPTPGGAGTPPQGPSPADILGGIVGPSGASGKVANELEAVAGKVSTSKIALGVAFKALVSASDEVFKDFMHLHSIGIQGSSSLGGLYIDAARAGMSLQEYTKVLQDASPAVTRAASMDDFNKTLQTSRDRLENLGIFGEEATKLSASMANSATTLGVPQGKLADATNAQIATFEHLRKTSLLTAEGFQEITASLSTQQEVQSQLLGLAPQERAARMNELTQIKTIGLSYGSTKAASDSLGAALIATRNLTAPKRFEAAGRIRQAGALYGMDTGETETLARLARKKTRTIDEEQQFVDIGGRLQQAIEAAMQSGDINQENIAEQISQGLEGSGIGEALKQSGNMKLTTDSGQAGANKNFAQGASDLLKATGRLNAWIAGGEKNPIVKAIMIGFGSIAASMATQGIFKKLFGGARVAAEIPGGGPPAPPRGFFGGIKDAMVGAKDGIADLFRTVGGGIKSGLGGLKNSFMSIVNWLETPFRIGPGEGVFADIATVWGKVVTGWGKLVDGGKNLFNYLSDFERVGYDAGSAVAKTGEFFKGIGGKLGGAFDSMKAWGGGIADTLKGLVSGVGEGEGLLTVATKGAGTWAKRIPIIGQLLGVFIDGIGEMITGKLTAAFNPNGDAGIMSQIGNALFSIFNGFVGSFGWIADKIVSLFGGDGFHFENAFNKFTVFMKAGFMQIMADIAGVFGKGNPLEKYFLKSVDDTFAVFDQLQDSSKTVDSIGEDRKKQIDKQKAAAADGAAAAKDTTAAVTAVSDASKKAAGIFTDTGNLTSSIVNQAAMIAAPGQSPVNSVTPPAVNNAETPATTPTPAETTATAPAIPATDAVVAQLTQVVAILQQMLTAEQLQATGLDGLARSMGRTPFIDNETRFSLLNNSMKAA